MGGAVQGLPFLQREQDGTGQLRQRATEHRGIDNAPGNHTEERQAALQAGGTL